MKLLKTELQVYAKLAGLVSTPNEVDGVILDFILETVYDGESVASKETKRVTLEFGDKEVRIL